MSDRQQQPDDNPKLDKLKVQIIDADLTIEEKLQLGFWITGKGLSAAWTDALEGKPPE